MSRGPSPLVTAAQDEQAIPANLEDSIHGASEIPTMAEGSVERVDTNGADVASAVASHMAELLQDQDVLVPEKEEDGDDAATNTQDCGASSAADPAQPGVMGDLSATTDMRLPYQPVVDDAEVVRGRRLRRTSIARSQSPFAPAAAAPVDDFMAKSTSSGSSSDSESTVTQLKTEQGRLREVHASEDPDRALESDPPHRVSPRPDPLSFLEPDSPAITSESIRRSIEDSTARWRASQYSGKPASAGSTASSGSSSIQSDVFSTADVETNRSSSPDNSAHGNSPTPLPSIQPRTQFAIDSRRNPLKSYGTPEMPRGTANLPHIPPSELQPRLGAQSAYVKHLPRAEKLPLSGYQLLASRLSSSSHHHPAEPPIQPAYRRFETLNHRVLLHLQDELAEMEEQLHRLDTADTQTRRLKSCILPASRRGDFLAGGELQWHKTDILGKIGYKLEQYNRVLSSFIQTQRLANPSSTEVEQYRSFLDTQNPVTELETRFLDNPDDLIALHSPDRAPFDGLSSGEPTPMPRPATEPLFPAPASENPKEASKPKDPDPPPPTTDATAASTATARGPAPRQVSHHSLAAALAVSVLLPVLSFSSMPGILGRMTVIWLVAVGLLNPLLMAGGVQGTGVGPRDAVACAAIYGGAMSVVAAVFP
ncbi:uncharacterized protein DNG_02196 [Cephalotrichum gorgonifer]|uniref:DUF6594 domain-containing protein n=1 Tax=Cephalotrichum gorgonifer TaxID=2041049 RepID=A0AAE8MTB7_9PEZI|nr:uncharacterized protein DNG_02196 [Cephalotrichum gorgonifer]